MDGLSVIPVKARRRPQFPLRTALPSPRRVRYRRRMPAISADTRSILGQQWCWRGGNMDLTGDAGHAVGLGVHLVDQLLLARGVAHEDLARHRKPTLRAFMPDPSIFRDMDVAADRLAQAVLARERITIYGDYDVDGATSAALLILLLRALGVDAGHYIPDRLLEGYGPSGEALVKLAEAGSSLIVTVDCGAMAHEALAAAHQAGVDVIVVDHHKCAAELPITAALVNPNRLDESDEAAAHGHLAAVGMAFLLAVATVRTLRTRGALASGNEPDLMALLDLVALGTVADVAQLKGLNRAMVAQGLKVMGRRENIGLAALIDASRLSRAPTCSDLGFALGPRINAGGRVGEADLGVRLLTTRDPDEARDIAARLSVLNEERRAIERVVQDEAETQLAAQHNRAVIVVAGRGWHPGVIGIVAGRLKEKTGKPALVIALETDEAGHGKGSGRSIGGVDLGAAIIAARAEGLLVAGGGHAMAAGLTVARGSHDALSDWLDARLTRECAVASGRKALAMDLSLAPGGLNPEVVETLEAAGPFGMGWPGPRVMVGPVRVVKADLVGTDHVRLIVAGDDGARFKAIAFRAAETELGQTLLHGSASRKLWLAGRPKVDDWGSRPAAELHLEDAAFAD